MARNIRARHATLRVHKSCAVLHELQRVLRSRDIRTNEVNYNMTAPNIGSGGVHGIHDRSACVSSFISYTRETRG